MQPGDVQLMINRDEDVLVDAVYDYCVGLRILGNALAMAGNFLARDLEGASAIVFAPLDPNLESTQLLLWLFSARGTLIRGLTCCFTCAGVTHRESRLRVDWNTHPTVASRAAPRVSVFSRTGVGRALRSPRRHRQRVPGASPKPAARRSRSRPKTTKRRSPRRSSPDSRRVQTVAQINGGMHVCKLFNDDRGCAADEKDCPLKARHVCDVRLSSQSACAGDHPRKQCPRAVRWGQHPAVAFTKVTAVAFLDRNDRLSPSLPQGREARLRYVVNSNVPDWEPLQLCDGRLLV